jgi:hypothetical protein
MPRPSNSCGILSLNESSALKASHQPQPIRRPGLCLENRVVYRPKTIFDNISFHSDFAGQNQALMSYSISTLLIPNLHEVFGENDPADDLKAYRGPVAV